MEPFKEQLNLKNAKIIADEVKNHYKKLDTKVFLNNIEKTIPSLELKQRANLIANELSLLLPKDYKSCFQILVQASKNLHGFKSLPLTEIVVLRKSTAPLISSLETLFKLTSSFSSEFAMRPFLEENMDETLVFLREKIKSTCEHERRLVSESTRPLLPWGTQLPKFKENPEITWPILKVLLFDDSPYVQKSVANHLNDHSKNHPEWLIEKLNSFKNIDLAKNKNFHWILKHSLRTLIKEGNKNALKLIGINSENVVIMNYSLENKKIVLGSKLNSQVIIKNKSKKAVKVIIDHVLHLLRANGKYNTKVFKGKSIEFKPMEVQTIKLNLTIKKVTTRKYYKGTQHHHLKINGVDTAKKSFELV